jgi:hypothetical protein
MSTVIDCPSCRRKLNVPPSLQGQLVKCPTCAATFDAAVAEGTAPSNAWFGSRPPPMDSPEAPPYPQPGPAYPYRRPDEDEHGDRGYGWRRRYGEKPGKVHAVAVMTLVGGILAIVHSLVLLLALGASSLGVCCLWPGPYYGLVMGIMATVKGSQLLAEDAYRMAPPVGTAVMQVINIINLDVPNCVMGIVSLVFLNDPEVRDYFRG